MYCKELTRSQLLDWGFACPKLINGQWHVYRYWRKCGPSNARVLKEIKITEAVCKHKYTKEKKYQKITFSVNQRGISIPLSRFIFAWFAGIAHEGMDIEHIDNDPYNNNIFNLRECTREENLAKRFSDNPENWQNQWGPKNETKLVSDKTDTSK